MTPPPGSWLPGMSCHLTSEGVRKGAAPPVAHKPWRGHQTLPGDCAFHQTPGRKARASLYVNDRALYQLCTIMHKAVQVTAPHVPESEGSNTTDRIAHDTGQLSVAQNWTEQVNNSPVETQTQVPGGNQNAGSSPAGETKAALSFRGQLSKQPHQQARPQTCRQPPDPSQKCYRASCRHNLKHRVHNGKQGRARTTGCEHR